MRPDVAEWFAARTWFDPPWTPGDLVAAKAGRKVSVVLPALDEEGTVAGVVDAVIDLTRGPSPLVDELVVVDSGSTDATVARARSAGARVVLRDDVLPDVPVRPGKGEVLWRSLAATSGDLVVFLDSDLVDVDPRFVHSLLGPLLTVPGVDLVKGFYHRPLRLDADDVGPTGGGRVTELTARPVLASLRPGLGGIMQPLGGEYAATRSLLESVPFAPGYGVEIGLLLDTHTTRGLDAIAQVDLGVRKHRHRSVRALGATAAEVLEAALRRCVARPDEPSGVLTQFVLRRGDWVADEYAVAVADRPPMREAGIRPVPGIVGSCPKRMIFGPCGGLRDDGGCELDPTLSCPWADPAEPVGLRRWHTPIRSRDRAPDQPPGRADTAPLVLADLSVPPFDLRALRAGAEHLAPFSDAVLIGEHHHRPTFPPTMVAAELLDAGARPWITLTCRDRNRLVLEQEIAGLAALGIEGVLCVTGDSRSPDVRPDVTQVFDLDSTRLTHLVASMGVRAMVAVAPSAPPTSMRAQALAEKQHAGASIAVVNHVSSPKILDDFLTIARPAGADLPVIAGVAVYTDEASARVLQAFPGLALDDEVVAEVLGARDSVEAGIEAAVRESRALLDVPGVVGVNLSGRGSSDGWERAVEIHAEIGRRLRRELISAIGTEPRRA